MLYLGYLFLLVLFIKDRATQIFASLLAVWLIVFNITAPILYSLPIDFFTLNASSCLVISTLAYILKDYRFAIICASHLVLSVVIYSATEIPEMINYVVYTLDASVLIVMNTLGWQVEGKRANIWFALVASLLYLLLPKGFSL